jgi:hypothetical protein
MELDVTGRIVEWRGPAPYWFLPVSDDDSAMIDELKPMLTYGWGCIPVTCRLGRTTFTTSIMPKDGVYLIPLKVAVRTSERVSPDAPITIHVEMALR